MRTSYGPPQYRGPHPRERIRDVPASCCCTWKWTGRDRKFIHSVFHRDCPWHELERSMAALTLDGWRLDL